MLLAAPSVLPAAAQLPEIRQASAGEILADIRSKDVRLTLVNFWATWCLPCREEFPDLVRIGRDFGPHGVRVLFVSADFGEELPDARHFLAEHGVKTQSYMRSGGDQAFINAFNPEWSGALPATALYGPGGERVAFWEGKRTYDEIQESIRGALSRLDKSD